MLTYCVCSMKDEHMEVENNTLKSNLCKGEKVMPFIPLKKDRLKQLTKLWNKNLGNEFPMTDKLFEQNSFQNKNVCYKSSLIAVDGRDRIIGYIIAKRWQEDCDVVISETIGWIQVLLVDQDACGEGIGSKLLAMQNRN